jgi:hypothetical protein
MEVETAGSTGIFDGKVNGTGIGLVGTVGEIGGLTKLGGR